MGRSNVIFCNNWGTSFLDWETLLEEFLNLKSAEGKSDRTVLDYRKFISIFFSRYPDAVDNPSSLRNYIFLYLKDAKTPTTYNLRLQNLRVFFDWLIEEEAVKENPLCKFKKKRNPGKFVPVDQDILKTMLSLPDRSTYSGLRDYALIMFTLDTATRPGEALQLLPSNCNLRSLEVTIPSHVSKTRISRTLYISSSTSKCLRKLLRIRHPQWKDNVPIFCSRDGKVMKETSWGQQMRRYSLKLGYKVTPYMLRHSSATLFLRNGGNAMALQRMMGHATMEMTERYVHLVEGDIRDQHAKFSPLQGIVEETNRIQKIQR